LGFVNFLQLNLFAGAALQIILIKKYFENSHKNSHNNQIFQQVDAYLQLDLGQPLEDQGPFDAILHKMTAMYAQALCGDIEVGVQIKNREYLEYQHASIKMSVT
jgi:hypothetical protein